MIFRELSSLDGDKSWALFVDTSSRSGQLLAYNSTQVLFERSWDENSKHDQVLNHHFLEASKTLDLKNLKFIVCSMGPGSFTGLRVSATFCKILSLSVGKVPIYGLSSFYLHAHDLLVKKKITSPEEFTLYIPSIGKKYFKSKFVFQNDTNFYHEEVDLSGAKEHPLDKENDFVVTPQALQTTGEGRRLSLDKSEISPYFKKFTYLDFYPLFLRQSEAEEKVKI